LPWLNSALRLNQNRWRTGEPVYVDSGPNRISMVNSNFSQDMPKNFLVLKMKDMQNYWNELNQEIPEFFKDDPRFLEMRICDGNNDGWEKLCNFLEKDIPDVDFPKLKSNNIIFPDHNK
jgi:hypothetical protein